jgi:hypothetical protein
LDFVKSSKKDFNDDLNANIKMDMLRGLGKGALSSIMGGGKAAEPVKAPSNGFGMAAVVVLIWLCGAVATAKPAADGFGLKVDGTADAKSTLYVRKTDTIYTKAPLWFRKSNPQQDRDTIVVVSADTVFLEPGSGGTPKLVYVNKGTSYIIFNHKIYAHSTGTDAFVAQAYENCLMLRYAGQKESERSSVFVSYGDSTYLQYYYAVLEYKGDSFNEYYDERDEFNRSKISVVQERQMKMRREEDKEDFFISELKTRSDIIKRMPDEVYDYGITEDGIGIYLRLIRTDNNYAYLKFVVENSTSVGYNFEHISFQYVERYRQGIFRKKREKYTDVFAVVMNSKLSVGARSKEPMVYIIPVFGIRRDEWLSIIFRENKGTRKLVFEIENEVIMKSKLLQTGE